MIKIVQALADLHGDNFAIVVNHSGGKYSQRMLGFIRENFPDVNVVMADTGFEHVQPVSAEDFARQSSTRFGLPLHVVRNPNKTYLEMVERRGMFPSSATRQCTSDLKRGPIEKFIRHLDEKVIINCMGIRAEESTARAKQNPWKINAGLSIAGRQVWNWMPIFEEKLMEVLRWHWTHQMPLHPVYIPAYHADETKGGYLRRLSCRVCIFSTDADVKAIYQHDREAFDLVASLEKRINFTMRSGKSLFQIIGQADSEDAEPKEEYPCAA
jgi:3'-phosphoadenosine 5'-phosphosulfate sulfotransferase (PAPS reductase)/FAD synthetase